MTTETTQSWQLTKALEDIRYRARKAEASMTLGITPIENARAAIADTPDLLAAIEAVLVHHASFPSLTVRPCAQHYLFAGMDTAATGETHRNCPDCEYEEGFTCMECRDGDGTLAAWPCPTYKAIAGALTGKDRDDG